MASPTTSILGVLALVASDVLAAITRDSKNKLKASESFYEGQIFGPESVVFDSQGRGPDTGIADGRVMRKDGDEQAGVAFPVIGFQQDGGLQPTTTNIEHELLCGRPLGLHFDKLWTASLERVHEAFFEAGCPEITYPVKRTQEQATRSGLEIQLAG